MSGKKRVNNEILQTTRNEKFLQLLGKILKEMILPGLTKNFAIFIVDVYEFNSGSRKMVFREIERIAL